MRINSARADLEAAIAASASSLQTQLADGLGALRKEMAEGLGPLKVLLTELMERVAVSEWSQKKPVVHVRRASSLSRS